MVRIAERCVSWLSVVVLVRGAWDLEDRRPKVGETQRGERGRGERRVSVRCVLPIVDNESSNFFCALGCPISLCSIEWSSASEGLDGRGDTRSSSGDTRLCVANLPSMVVDYVEIGRRREEKGGSVFQNGRRNQINEAARYSRIHGARRLMERWFFCRQRSRGKEKLFVLETGAGWEEKGR